MSKNQTITDKNPEVLVKDIWQPARELAHNAKMYAKMSVACQVMLGFHLVEIKKEIGYTQGRKSAKKKKPINSVFSTWADHCKAEIGYTDDTVRKFINMAEGAKSKLKSTYKNLPLNKSIQDFTDEEKKLLESAVDKVTDGQTQSSFLIECGIAKAPQGSAATGGNLGDDDAPPPVEPTMQQVAYALFASPLQDICTMRTSSQYAASLRSLPISSDNPEEPSLQSLELQAESLLKEVREAKEALMKSQLVEA